MDINHEIEQANVMVFDDRNVGLMDFSYFAEPNQSKDEVQLAIFGTTFTFAELDKAQYDSSRQVWVLGEHELKLLP